MNNWLAGMLDALFGTFHRTRNTIIAGFVLLMLVSETFRHAVLLQMQNLVLAALGPLLLLALVVGAFRMILGPLFGARRRH